MLFRSTELPDHPDIGGPAIRIGAFLSIFNVHINRSPCAGRVVRLEYAKGEFLDARHPASGNRNEANLMVLDTDMSVGGPVVVRQVAGKVARRIICNATVGDTLATGQRFGMIKFGSRTDLLVPPEVVAEVSVRVGQMVQGGSTVLLRLKPRGDAERSAG